MYTFLISGATGFLGNIIQQYLGKSNDLETVSLSGITSHGRIDIAKPFSIPPNLSFDAVIHCAGKAHVVPKTKEESQLFYDINYSGTINLCRALEELPTLPKSFIFVSTVAVYGIDKGYGIEENAPLLGTTPYAKSKIMAEEWLRDWAHEKKIILSIIRLPLIAGPNPPGNLGAMIKGMKSGKYVSIGKADAKKSIVWAEDIAALIPKLVETGGTFNLTDGYNPTFGELERAISKTLSKKPPLKIPLFMAKLMGYIGDCLGARAPISSDKVGKITSTLTFSDKKAVDILSWKPHNVLNQIDKVVNG